jgi:hypothetical protein
MNFNVTLTEAENLALGHVALSQEEWINNVIHERCRVAMDDIMKIALEKSIETSTTLPTSKDEIVLLAFNRGWVKLAKDTQPEPLV